ncbi:50S ribosomal protein L17 [Candidatus Saccharibacteria bacterium]|nr:50S ribosomal protein L17 [Candidatus Saccharibacteria bacterium]HOR23342.1 50S ribosomal protein L17 [Candidatus Saccharibacteria bacterium]
MHRHGYKGRKLHRKMDQRRALIKGLASSLSENESIETTLPKAKELVPYFERLITKAKKGNLHNRRQIISKMANVYSAHKLVDEIAPKLGARNSGHLRIEKTNTRRGDNAQMARVSFVDDLTKKTKSTASKSGDEKQLATSSKVDKKAVKEAK